MIHPPGFLPFASIEAFRPVFLIVMGSFLCLIAWRLAQRTGGVAGKLMKVGGVLLAVGYAVIIPLYEAKLVPTMAAVQSGAADPGLGAVFHLLKMLTMNCGWLLAGAGVAVHARLFETTRVVRPVHAEEAAVPVPVTLASHR